VSTAGDHERSLVELLALPDDVPPVVRLRKFLKAALRSYRLRCTSARRERRPGNTALGSD
jgi:hypothetical protein